MNMALVPRVDPAPINPVLGIPQIRLPDLGNTFGALLMGTFLGLVLLGVTLHQAYRYARIFPNDSRWLKSLVALAVFLETVSSGLSMHQCYHYMVANYFNPQSITLGVWSTNLFPAIAGAVMVVSQSFFARRVWLLEPRYRPVVVCACVLSLAELGIFIAGTALEFITNNPENTTFTRLLPIAFCLAMAADLMLTSSLIHILRRKRTGFTGTDTMIDIMLLYAVNTGLLNGIFDLLTTILAFTRPKSTVWAAFGIAGAKLYAITLLAALHSRRTIRSQGTAELQDSDAVFGVSICPHASPDSHGVLRTGKTHRDVHPVRELHSFSTMAMSDVIELKARPEPLKSDDYSVQCLPNDIEHARVQYPEGFKAMI